jgi:hypothetical protein
MRAALSALPARTTLTKNGHSIWKLSETGKCVVRVFMSVYTRSCICSLPSETIQEYDKAMQELQVQDALAAYKKSNPEKDFVAVALDNLLAPETCPNCKSSYDVRPTASHGTFITPCTLPHVAHSSHRVHCITLCIHHTVYTASRCAFITPCTLHHVAHSSHRVHCITLRIHHTVYTASHGTFITPCTLHHVAHSSHRVHCITLRIHHTVYTASHGTSARWRMCCHYVQELPSEFLHVVSESHTTG